MPTTTTSTISQSGTPDYSTLQSWEDAAPANLVTSDVVWQGVIQQPDDNFSESLSITGGTTDATRYKELTVADGASIFDDNTNELRYNESVGASVTYAFGSATINCNENYFRVSRLQARSTATISGGQAMRSLATAGFQARDMVLQAGTSVSALPLFRTGSSLINCYFIAGVSSTNTMISLDVGASTLLNCMFIAPDDMTDATNAITSSVNTNTITNCGFFGVSNITSVAGQSFTTCFGNDASPPTGCTTMAFDTTTGSGFTDIDTATLDLRLGSDSGLIDAGTDTADTLDAFGVTRTSGNYDIGPVEHALVGGGGGTNLLLMGVG